MEDTFPWRFALKIPSKAWWMRSATRALVLGLLTATAGCSNHIGTTAASFLRRVREDPDPNLRYLAYSKLANRDCYETAEQRHEAVQTLLEKYDKGKEPTASRAAIIRTLGELGDHAAREVVIRAISDPDPLIRVEACRALGKVGETQDATVLTRVMMVDTLEDARIAAIDALGVLKPNDPRISRVLIDGMQHEDPATRLASLAALRNITGKDLGVDASAWEKLLAPEASPINRADQEAIAKGPSYPPRPTPVAMPDPEAETASYAPKKPRSSVPMTSSNPQYPSHNPNLPQ